MRYRSRSITWHGQDFNFQRLRPPTASADASLWAVFRRGEFIGTMPCAPDVTTRDFDVRGLRWLGELLGDSVRRGH